MKSEILTEINTEKLSLVKFMLKMSKIYDIKSENNENRKKNTRFSHVKNGGKFIIERHVGDDTDFTSVQLAH